MELTLNHCQSCALDPLGVVPLSTLHVRPENVDLNRNFLPDDVVVRFDRSLCFRFLCYLSHSDWGLFTVEWNVLRP